MTDKENLKYTIECVGEGIELNTEIDGNEVLVAFPTTQDFVKALASVIELDTVQELIGLAHNIINMFPGDDKENKEYLLNLVKDIEAEYSGELNTDGLEDMPSDIADDILDFVSDFLRDYQELEFMKFNPDIFDDVAKEYIDGTAKNFGDLEDTALVLDKSSKERFWSYNTCNLSIHRKLIEAELTDEEKAEYSKLIGDNIFDEPCDYSGASREHVAAYNTIAAIRIAKRILNK